MKQSCHLPAEQVLFAAMLALLLALVILPMFITRDGPVTDRPRINFPSVRAQTS